MTKSNMRHTFLVTTSQNGGLNRDEQHKRPFSSKISICQTGDANRDATVCIRRAPALLVPADVVSIDFQTNHLLLTFGT